MARYVDLNNPHIIKLGRDRFGDVMYHIPPDLPTLDVRENVHAHWVDEALEGFPEITFPVCSNCGEDALDYVESNFCPHCGAVMDEREGDG